MIVVDDGSIDNSKEVILSYKSKFETRGYSLVYVYQENSGQSVAIKNALSLVQGEFLAWPDSDDFYKSQDSISILVSRLKSASSDYAIVRSWGELVRDNSLEYIQTISDQGVLKEDLFYECLFSRKGFYFCSGAYLIRFDVFRQETNSSFFTHKKAGQNWQLLLPIMYKYKCLTVRQVLYTVIDRQNSHSRKSGLTQELDRQKIYYETLVSTLDNIKDMPLSEKKHLCDILYRKYLRLCLYFAGIFKGRKEAKKYFNELRGGGLEELIFYFAIKSGLLYVRYLRTLFLLLYHPYSVDFHINMVKKSI